MTAPLRKVTERGRITGGGHAHWDTLECEHVVPFDGAYVERRRCPDCPPTPAVEDTPESPGDLPLF